jgi:hypothetical protein
MMRRLGYLPLAMRRATRAVNLAISERGNQELKESRVTKEGGNEER